MTSVPEEWEERATLLWASLQELEPEEFRGAVAELIAELPAGHPRGLFETACACDSTGESGRAVPLYQAALEAGLSGLSRRRANIQLASSLRNLGQPGRAVEVLSVEAGRGEDELSTSVSAFQALALSDLGQDRAALALALTALSTHLPRYNASLRRYALALVENDVESDVESA